MEVGPVPEQREDGGVIERRRRNKPAELPRKLHEGEISAGRAMIRAAVSMPREEKGETKKLSKNENTKGEKACRLLFVGSAFCHGCLGRHEEMRNKLQHGL